MEYAKSNLKLVIQDINKPLNDQLPKFYFSQIFYGVAYLHFNGIMHRVRRAFVSCVVQKQI